jgi:CHASE3 domain sensor protein
MKTPSYLRLRELREFCIAAGVFLSLVALFAVYLLVEGLSAVYQAIGRQRQIRNRTTDRRGHFV